MLYGYAFTDAAPGGLERVRGVLDEPVQALTVHGLTAVVGELPTRPLPDARSLRRHDAVVRALTAACRGVLPIRFGQTAGDVDEFASRIAPRQAALEDALRLVTGSLQMTLRVLGEPVGEPSPPPSATSGAGTRYLEARRRALDVPGLSRLRAHLAAYVRADGVRHAPLGPFRASLYQLVLRSRLAEWRARLAEFAFPPELRVTVSGPWAPYAFTPEHTSA